MEKLTRYTVAIRDTEKNREVRASDGGAELAVRG